MRNRSSISTRALVVLTPPTIVHLLAVIFWNLQRAKHDVWCSQSINNYCDLTPASGPLDYATVFYTQAISPEWWEYHFDAVVFIVVVGIVLLTLFTAGTWIIKGRVPRLMTRVADWFDGPHADVACIDRDCTCVAHRNQTFVTKWQPRS